MSIEIQIMGSGWIRTWASAKSATAETVPKAASSGTPKEHVEQIFGTELAFKTAASTVERLKPRRP
jgi:hypothetical protein